MQPTMNANTIMNAIISAFNALSFEPEIITIPDDDVVIIGNPPKHEPEIITISDDEESDEESNEKSDEKSDDESDVDSDSDPDSDDEWDSGSDSGLDEDYYNPRENGKYDQDFDDLTDKNDKELVLKAVQRSHRAQCLQFASDTLRDDNEVVYYAARQDGRAMQYASERLRNDKDFLKAIMSIPRHFYIVRYASKLLDDEDFILEIATEFENAGVLEFASDRLKNSKELVVKVLVAVHGVGYNLKVASSELQDDKEVVLRTIQNNKKAIKFASERLRSDKKFILDALDVNCHLDMKYVAPHLQNLGRR